MRDLASADLWQQSLERSRSRRAGSAGKPPAASPVNRARPRAAPSPAVLARPRPAPAAGIRSRAALGSSRLGLGAACLLGALLFVATVAYLTGDGGAAAATPRHPATATRPVVIGTSIRFARTSTSAPMACQPAGRGSGYANPLARAQVRGERIDQGVDYAGRGALVAIGAARVTFVGTGGTGWPGAFIEYRLLSGPDAGCFVYYAEGVNPAARLRVGQVLAAGQPIATIIPGWSTGIELGWGAGRSTTTLALRHGWTQADDAQDRASAAGRSFSALVAGLGGPAGRVEH